MGPAAERGPDGRSGDRRRRRMRPTPVRSRQRHGSNSGTAQVLGSVSNMCNSRGISDGWSHALERKVLDVQGVVQLTIILMSLYLFLSILLEEEKVPRCRMALEAKSLTRSL